MQITLIFITGILLLAYIIPFHKTHDVFYEEQTLTSCVPVMNIAEKKEG